MSELIRVPDIGSGEGEVIEILVKVGDRIEAEQSLLTLESDKASMEIPAPKAGVIKSLAIKLGDRLKEGDDLLELEVDEGPAESAEPEAEAAAEPAAPAAKTETVPSVAEVAAENVVEEIHVPDIGSAGKARVIEVMVAVGDEITEDQSLITLESDKASMEIPSPVSGEVVEVLVRLDAEVGTGDLIFKVKVAQSSAAVAEDTEPALEVSEPAPQKPSPAVSVAPETAPVGAKRKKTSTVHAGPAVRKLAREFGVDLGLVTGTGPHKRVMKEDVHAYVQSVLNKQASGASESGSGIPAVPEVDFARFGEIEEVPMTRLQQVAAMNLHRSWLNVPHVTQFEESDITELEAFRVSQKAVAEKAGVKLTILPFLLKVCAHLLKEMPDFNSSLAPSGKALIRKKYVHLGFAVDTPEGLLVPVIRDVDQKSLLQLAEEAAELAEKARTKKLRAEEMQGACFTISSLGHIGGVGFTPIVNTPEVAILGVSRATMQPVWNGEDFAPRLILPLSLSYDHRVINGVAAAHFTRRLSELLAEIRSLLL